MTFKEFTRISEIFFIFSGTDRYETPHRYCCDDDWLDKLI